MPIYEFECTDCGNRFDRLQKLSDPDPTDCPSCQHASIRRRVTAPSFRLAGAGWYETDFKKDGDKKRNLAGGEDSSAKPDSGGKSESPAKTESAAKPEAAPASAPAPASKPADTPAS